MPVGVRRGVALIWRPLRKMMRLARMVLRSMGALLASLARTSAAGAPTGVEVELALLVVPAVALLALLACTSGEVFVAAVALEALLAPLARTGEAGVVEFAMATFEALLVSLARTGDAGAVEFAEAPAVGA